MGASRPIAKCALVHKTLSAIQIKDLGSGNFGVCQLMVDLDDGEHVAVKFLPRGHKVCCQVVTNAVPGRTCYADAPQTRILQSTFTMISEHFPGQMPSRVASP